MSNFRNRYEQVMEELYQLSHSNEQFYALEKWFKRNFEEYHAEHAVSEEMLKFVKNQASFKEHVSKKMTYELAKGLMTNAVIAEDSTPRDEFGYPINPHVTTERFSVIVLRKEPKND